MPTYWLPIADEFALEKRLQMYNLPNTYAVWPNLAEGPGGIRYLPVELDAPPSITHLDTPPLPDAAPPSEYDLIETPVLDLDQDGIITTEERLSWVQRIQRFLGL